MRGQPPGLARLVVQYSPLTFGAFDLITLATVTMANAVRCRGELRQADEHSAMRGM